MSKFVRNRLHRWRQFALVVAAASVAAAVVALPAAADTSSSVTATIAVAPQIKSVKLSTSSLTFGSCGTQGNLGTATALQFPNGTCSASSVNVASDGTLPEAILVQGAPAIPTDNGTPWVLAGSTTTPGTDNYTLKLTGSSTVWLSSAPQSDLNAGAGGSVLPGSTYSENPQLYGPAASTDQSTSFSTTVTWIAT